jgi:general secretion pathway protein J
MQRRARGFTLLEMLLAISLLVLLAGLAYGTLRIGVRGWETAAEHADQGDALRVAWPFLHQALEDAQPLAGADGQPLFNGDGDMLSWAAALPAHLALGRPQQLSLRAEPQPGARWPQLVLSYTDLASEVENRMPDDPREAIIVDELAGLEIRYFGRLPQDGTVGWQDSWRDRADLPLLVRLDVTPAEGLPWPSLFAHPRLAGTLRNVAEEQLEEPETDDARSD